MLKIHFVTILLFFITPLFAQNIAQVTIDNHGKDDIITFLADESVVLNITKDGKIIDWGTQYTTAMTGVYPRLEKYMGREEYYPATDDEAYRGKIKYIGRTVITYYTAADNNALKGKIKSIGINQLTYYTEYDDVAFRGYIRNAGPVALTYYSSFEDDFYKSKIKSIGSTVFSYYGSFDDKAYRGKIKNIDRNPFTYYSSYDRPEYNGAMKSGSVIVFSGSIKYIIRQ